MPAPRVTEKSSRLIEVILGAVTATEFMVGKILGVLGSGLTQPGIWLAVSLLVLLQGLPALGGLARHRTAVHDGARGRGWLSAKVFRYALLMTGKRPSIPELIRVVRAG